MEFKLPDIGEGIHEGEITKWLVKVGDPINADQPMVEVMTDKATVEIPSPVTGVIEELFAKEGQTIEVGKTLLKINTEAKAEGPKAGTEAKPEQTKAKPESAPASARASANGSHATATRDVSPVKKEGGTTAQGGSAVSADTESAASIPFHVLATPATRKLARDLDISLGEVTPTGPNNRVTKMDVQMAYEGQSAATPRSSHPSSSQTSMVPSGASSKTYVTKGALQVIPLKGIRKKIAEAMSHSKHTAAHFTYVEELDMTEIVNLRASAKKEAEKRGVKLTFLPFILKGLIPALQEFPFLNSSLIDEKQEIIVKGDYNIGIAVDTPQGLMVPNIKNADRKTLWELAEEITVLSEKARTGKIALDDLKGGTFTITNAGSIGGVFATPVINHPEVAILGVNAIRKRPVVKDDQIVIADVMFLSLSVDHRVVDGADAARFMNRLVYFLSDPKRLVFA